MSVRCEFTLQRVLLATDFSPECVAAFHYAAALAERFAAKLYVLHVISDEAEGPGARPSLRTREQRAGAHMERLREELLARVDECVTATLRGQPARRIVEKALQVDADIIVLGARPRELARAGADVMRAVCEESPCPVVCVPCPGEKGADNGAAGEP